MEQTQPVSTPNPEPVGFPGAVQPQPTQPKKNWKWLVILILFLLVIGGVTFFVFKSSKSTASDQNATPTATSDLTNVATAPPTPTASPADKTALSISVLNGTGIAGEAGILADQLKNLGYTNVTTGNATTQNATDTQVTFSSNVPQSVNTEIMAKLNELYTSVTTGNSTLPSGVDIQITTGLRKGQTSAPAATDVPAATDTPVPSPTDTP